jgi:hypothetical protein
MPYDPTRLELWTVLERANVQDQTRVGGLVEWAAP